MFSGSRKTVTNAGAESRPIGSGPLVAGAAASLPSGSDATGAVTPRDDRSTEVPPAAAAALAQAVADGTRALHESTALCSVLMAVAVVCLAWSLPGPGASAGLTLLCLVLISVEHAQARARFQRVVARTGAEHGLTAPEADRAARALLEVVESERPRGSR